MIFQYVFMTKEDAPETRRHKKRPTAVAVEHQLGAKTLPKITAAGHGAIAEKILELAFANGVKVREDAALAEMLAKIELESEIPSEALIAVAEILAYVYRENGKISQKGKAEGE